MRDKDRDVANLGWMKPSVASAAIQQGLGVRFSFFCGVSARVEALQGQARQQRGREASAQDDPEYCRHDEAHDDYLYSQKYVDLIVTELVNPDTFKSVIGWAPKAL